MTNQPLLTRWLVLRGDLDGALSILHRIMSGGRRGRAAAATVQLVRAAAGAFGLGWLRMQRDSNACCVCFACSGCLTIIFITHGHQTQHHTRASTHRQ